MRSIRLRYFCLALAVAFLLRFLLALLTQGTNDVVITKYFMQRLNELGFIEIYRAETWMNHPPLFLFYLKILHFLEPHFNAVGLSWPFMVRIPAVMADAGSTLLIYQIAKAIWNESHAPWAALLFAVNPTGIMISGFHGNTDPVMMFLVLACLYVLLIRRTEFIAGMLLGLAMNIKVVPLLIWPAIFFWLSGWQQRRNFFGGTLLLLLTGFGYHIFLTDAPVFERVFLYRSFSGIYGITKFAHKLGLNSIPGHRWLLLSAIVLVSFRTVRSFGSKLPSDRSQALLYGVAVSLVCFFVLTFGWSIQYFTWAVATIGFLGFGYYVAFALSTSVATWSIYNNWCVGDWMAYANADNGLSPTNSLLLDLVWIVFAVMLSVIVKNLLSKHLPQPN
jgi:Gpi18-like mannosyltransferase